MRYLLFFALVFAGAQAGAQETDHFKGVYTVIEGGYVDLQVSALGISATDDSGVFGAALGFRGPLTADGRLIVGGEGNYDFIVNGSNSAYGASGIIGYRVTDKWMIYGRAGYTRWDADINLDAFHFGGGVEVKVFNKVSLRLDYQRLIFEDIVIESPLLVEPLNVDVDGNVITVGIIYSY